jgi:hypothetical protein
MKNSIEAKSHILGYLFRDVLLEEDLLTGVASNLEVPREQVSLLDTEQEQSNAVVVECYYRQKGFLTDVTLYLDSDNLPKYRGQFELAQAFAQHFQQDVLVAPPTSWEEVTESVWFLVKSSGEMFRVKEEVSDDDAVVIDETPSQMQKLDLSAIAPYL